MITAFRLLFDKYLPKESLRARFVAGSFWVVVGTGVQQLFGLIGTVVVARYLGTAGFGQLSVIQNTIGMFGMFAGLGLSLTATKHVAEYRKTDPEKANNIIGLTWLVALIFGVAMTIVVFGSAGIISKVILKAPELVVPFKVASIMLLFSILMGAQRGVLSGLEAFRTVAITAFLQGVIQVVLTIIGTKLYQLQGAVWSYTISYALGWAISAIFVRIEIVKAKLKIQFNNIRQELPVLWKFSLPALMSSSIFSPILWAANAIIVNMPNGFSEVGIYNAAARFQQMVSFVGLIFSSSLLPILSSKEGRESQTLQRGNIAISWVAGFYPAMFLICIPEIFGIFGKGFSGDYSNKILILVMIATTISNYYQGLARVLVARGMLWWSLLNSVIWAVVLILPVYLFREYGAMALAFSTVAAYAVSAIIFMPLFINEQIVPQNTIFSRAALLIWLILFCAAALYPFNVNFAIRCIYFLVSISASIWLFHKILYPKESVLKSTN
jgi:O-antigen/teichoic acid export membrane protein